MNLYEPALSAHAWICVALAILFSGPLTERGER
jgi:hypothetical protein